MFCGDAYIEAIFQISDIFTIFSITISIKLTAGIIWQRLYYMQSLAVMTFYFFSWSSRFQYQYYFIRYFRNQFHSVAASPYLHPWWCQLLLSLWHAFLRNSIRSEQYERQFESFWTNHADKCILRLKQTSKPLAAVCKSKCSSDDACNWKTFSDRTKLRNRETKTPS